MKIVISDNNTYTYCAGWDIKTKCPFLISYWYGKQASIQRFLHSNTSLAQKSSPLYLDSGVFSARKKGIILGVKGLIDFYHAHANKIDYVFSMDEGDMKNQLRNIAIMKSAGVPVIGIWHGTMPLDYLDRISEITDYIAISLFVLGNQQTFASQNPQRYNYFDMVFRHLYKRNIFPIKVHLLGTEQYNILARYPIFSADSTGIVSTYSFIKGARWNEKERKIKTFSLKKDKQKALQECGPEYVRLRQENTKGRVDRIRMAIKQRDKLQEFLTNLWKERGIVWNEDK